MQRLNRVIMDEYWICDWVQRRLQIHTKWKTNVGTSSIYHRDVINFAGDDALSPDDDGFFLQTLIMHVSLRF